jgi:dTDP-4-dehydrorhamnose reductase
VYHLGGATPLSRYDFAKKIAKEFSFDGERIQPALTMDMNWVAKRPVNSSLSIQKAFKTLDAKPMRIEEALAQLRKEMESEVIEE